MSTTKAFSQEEKEALFRESLAHCAALAKNILAGPEVRVLASALCVLIVKVSEQETRLQALESAGKVKP